MSIYIGDKEIKNLYVGKSTEDYSAMRGPCAVGFHIPLQTEWQEAIDIGISFGLRSSSSGAGIKTYLKMPYAGYRKTNSSASVTDQGSIAYYHSSRCGSDNRPRLLQAYNSYLSANVQTSGGMSIRPFKDEPVIPDSSRTVLYQGTGTAGIYHNSSLGLISMSSDGSTRYTIADKNLGATQVYNDGDTLSDANCGKYYQRGNNYGFAWTGSVSRSSSQVNASTYGPGNYYSSSTFITSSSWWDSSENTNLRGGETGITEKGAVKAVYLGETKVRPPTLPYLCFTANTAGSTVQLTQIGGPTSVTLETSTDGTNWSTYTFGNTITLNNIGDKVYWRNTSETDTGFSIDGSNYYKFVMTGSIAASGDVTSLLNKNGTTTLSNYCFIQLFYQCTSLTTPPLLPVTTLGQYCCYNMFRRCTALTSLPKLPATTLEYYCYGYMFERCSNIKISTSQTGDYQTPYRIPTTGTGTTATNALTDMFDSTGGTFTGTPSINTTYYTSNTVV